MIELYHGNGSICAQKVRLVPAEKGIEAVEHHLDPRARRRVTDWFARVRARSGKFWISVRGHHFRA